MGLLLVPGLLFDGVELGQLLEVLLADFLNVAVRDVFKVTNELISV